MAEHRYEYGRLSEVWRGHETKAQATAAVAGVFVGALYSFVRDCDSDTPAFERIGLSIVLFCLVATVLSAIGTLRVRTVVRPPTGIMFDEWVAEVIDPAPPEEVGERELLLLFDRNRQWKELNGSIGAANSAKKRWLIGSQVLLATSVVLMALMTGWIVWRR